METEDDNDPLERNCCRGWEDDEMSSAEDDEEEQETPTWRGGGGGRGEKAEVGGTNGAAGEPSIQSLHNLWSRGTGR